MPLSRIEEAIEDIRSVWWARGRWEAASPRCRLWRDRVILAEGGDSLVGASGIGYNHQGGTVPKQEGE